MEQSLLTLEKGNTKTTLDQNFFGTFITNLMHWITKSGVLSFTYQRSIFVESFWNSISSPTNNSETYGKYNNLHCLVLELCFGPPNKFFYQLHFECIHNFISWFHGTNVCQLSALTNQGNTIYSQMKIPQEQEPSLHRSNQ